MNTTSLTPFNGSDYDHDRDAPRLTEQIKRVFEVLSTHQWVTLAEIAAATGDPEASISAQIRHLRKARFGSWDIQKRHNGNGLYSYRMTGEKTTPSSEPAEDSAPLPPSAPELLKAAEIRISQLEGQVEDLMSFQCDVIAGCDISKGSQGLFRQKRVVIGQGKTQDEIDLERAEAKCDELTSALRAVLEIRPAGSSSGGCFYERFDGDGNCLGAENVDPMSVIQDMAEIAEEGLSRAARLDSQISTETP